MSHAEILTEWSNEPFEHAPIANGVGPFPHRSFLETWWQHMAGEDRLALVTSGDGTLALRESDGRVLFCGDPDLTDYHSPLGEASTCIRAAAEAFTGRKYSLDSLPEEAATNLHGALDDNGHPHAVARDGVTIVIDLQDGDDGWLAGLRKKDRHEIRRKLRNFSAALGEPTLDRRSDSDAVAAFAALHRSSPGVKGGFMRPDREAFFADLVSRAGGSVEILSVGGDVVAAAFGFARDDGYYLYNSAYALDAADSSPGIVLLATLIDALIEEGVPKLDLLKGDEPYKLRLGGNPRRLYRIEGTFS